MRLTFTCLLIIAFIGTSNSVIGQTSPITATYNPYTRTVSASYDCNNDPFHEREEVRCPGDPYDECWEETTPRRIDWYFFFRWAFPPGNPMSNAPTDTKFYQGVPSFDPICYDSQTHVWRNGYNGISTTTLWNQYNVCITVTAHAFYNDGTSKYHSINICHFQ